MIRQNAAGRRGQILHLTAYRPIGNGELGSMPPYYPPLAPFFPGFGVVFRPLVPLLLHPGADCLKNIFLQTLSACLSSRANRCALCFQRAHVDIIAFLPYNLRCFVFLLLLSPYYYPCLFLIKIPHRAKTFNCAICTNFNRADLCKTEKAWLNA